ncbi:hypothetical protein BGZ57DRAFT_959212 [Hyaloscypha finlandica]|nr:hypothetical protein BGZ57DRAFT_959212 [Hyaloscypha finlandica]
MAILSLGPNTVKVCIRRHPQNTYFNEYVKIGDQEKTDATSCNRYIIPEPGQMYTIEVTLKRGYNFGNAGSVSASLCLPGVAKPISALQIRPPNDYKNFIKEDLKVHLTYIKRVRVDGRSISGARLVFGEVSIDEDLQNETNVMGVDPKDLGSLRIEVKKEKFDLVPMTPGEHAKMIKQDSKEINNLDRSQTLWDVEKIDQENFKKHGITATVGFVGGHPSQPSQSKYRITNYRHGEPLEFLFHCRPAEFLEQVNIVPYPPPLHSFPWEQLNEDERNIALQQLQELSKKRATQYGQIELDPNDWQEEWDSWNEMQPYERKYAFKKLQQEQKTYRRRQVQNQINEIPASRIQDLDRDTPDAATEAGSRGSDSRPIVIHDNSPKVSSARKRPANSQLHRERIPSIKQDNLKSHPTAARRSITKGKPIERINVDGLSDAGAQMLPAPTIKYDIAQGNAASAKRVKFEEVPERDGVNLYGIKEFPGEAYQVVAEGKTEQEEVVADLDQIAEQGEDIAELESVTEDERTEEKKRAEAEQLARDNEEFERVKSETVRTIAGYMEELKSQK